MIILTPTLKPQNPVTVIPPQDLTESTFPMAVFKLLPTLLTKTDMSLMLNTREPPNTPNTNPQHMPQHQPPLTNPLIEQL